MLLQSASRAVSAVAELLVSLSTAVECLLLLEGHRGQGRRA